MTLPRRLPLSADQRTIAAQLLRFAISGGFVTLLGVGIYALAATHFGLAPLLATLAAYAVSGVVGYLLHSRFSFRGHGQRDNLARTGSRFFASMALGYALNSLFVWILTGPIGGAWWWPVPMMIFATPLIVFVVSRKWVFA
ncbi:MAG: GtrA family protein [Sphingomonadaceae bacterium]